MKKLFGLSLAFSTLLCPISVAQNNPNSTPCQPPQSNEYLVLVINQDQAVQEQIRRYLPQNVNSNICKYSEQIVTRVGSFKTIDDANAWAIYINQTLKLQSFVARSKPKPTATTGFNPQVLGAGYAVLIDYFNKPEIASQLQQTLSTNIGLVSYGQRPYLLAIHTSNQDEANTIFQQLSDRGFWVIITDSRRVTLLKSKVNSPES